MSKKSFFLICSLCVFCGSGFAQTLTQISDTLYNADGTKASGRMVISWDPFTTASNVTVDGGTKTYTIPATGASAGGVDVSLYPNAGATPAGTSYRVRYYLANGASYTETWVVPATGPVTIAGVRASIVPSPTVTFNPTTQLYNASIAKGTLLAGSGTAGYLGLLGMGANGLCLVADAAQSLGMKWGSCAGGGTGISSLNGQTGSSQTFANDTNVTISSASNVHTLGWAGTLGLARGGTNQSAWTAARCVRANNAGTSLESASADCGAGGGGNHNLLSTTHSDTTAGTVARGDLVIGQGAAAAWQRLALGASGRYLRSDGTDAAWSTIAAGDLPSTVVRTDQSNTYSGTTTHDFGTSTITLVAPKKTDPGSPATGELWINSGALKYRDNQGTPATQTAEIQSNKNAASGYAGLTASTKLTATQGQEVWALADLSDVAAATGSGTTVVLQTSPTLAGTPVIGDGAGNDKLSFTAESSNPGCATGNYFIWANSTDSKLKKCENATISDLGGGGGGGAPTDAQYVTLATNATLTAERVLTQGAGISVTDGGAGGSVTVANTGVLRLITKRYSSILPTGAATLVSGVGDNETSTSGTRSVAAPDANDGVAVNYASAASTNADAGASGFLNYRVGRNVDAQIRGSQKETSVVRFWIALTDQTEITMAASDNPAGNYAGFHYCNDGAGTACATDRTNWFACTKDGTTQGCTDTGVATDTASHNFQIIDGGSSWTFYMDGSLVATRSANLPSSGTNLRAIWGVRTLEAVAKNFRLYGVDVLVDK